jgi:hypothetical protein
MIEEGTTTLFKYFKSPVARIYRVQYSQLVPAIYLKFWNFCLNILIQLAEQILVYLALLMHAFKLYVCRKKVAHHGQIRFA